MITCHDHQLVEIVIGGSRGNSPSVREGLQVREAIIGIPRGWASRHQLYKHVNTHVYLGVWRITLNSVQAVVGDPHDHVDKPFCVAQLSYSQIWEAQIGSCESR